MDPFDPYSSVKFSIFYYSSLLAFIGHYNNHSGAYIAGTQNYIGAYIIMASLQALVNNLLVWQSTCETKSRPLNSKSICPAVSRCSAYNQNINKQLTRKLSSVQLV